MGRSGKVMTLQFDEQPAGLHHKASHMDPPELRSGFCIYIHTLCQGDVPAVSDGERYTVFETELEAQKEIADHMVTRLRQFLDGERDFEDAMTTEEFVVPVTVHPDGTIIAKNGGCFSARVE